MNVVSLFSGAGGLDLGFVQAGFNIVWANDNFLSACKTYSSNKKYFNAEMYDDPSINYNGKHRIFYGSIEKIKSFRSAVGPDDIDVIIGGFPCQDFSVLRGSESKGRNGITVKRGRLYCHFVRALKELKPKMFIAENVKGLVSANKGEAYKAIIADFENLGDRWGEIKGYGHFENNNNNNNIQGYKLIFKNVIDFSIFGVPQFRQRLILIGLRNDLYQKLKSSQEIQDLDKKFRINEFNNFSKYPMTPIEVLSGKTLDNLQNEYKSIMMPFINSIKNISSYKTEKYLESNSSKSNFNIFNDYSKINNINNGKISDIVRLHDSILADLNYNNSVDKLRYGGDHNAGIFGEFEHVSERMAHIPPGENFQFVRGTEHEVKGLMSNIYKRVHPLKPSPTIIACGGGGTWGYHYDISRQRLSHRERARLQTFPDDFVFKGRSGEIRTQIGNAVPPLASKYIAKEVKRILEII